MAARQERYMVKEVNAKVEVQPKVSKEQFLAKEVAAIIEVEPKKEETEQILTVRESTDKDNYVIVDRNVESEFTKQEEFDVLTVVHKEEILIVQGLDKKNWILKITRELSEKTFFKGNEMIDKISNRKENLERNKENPIVQAAFSWKNEKFMESTSDERSSDDETPNTTKVVVENVKKQGEENIYEEINDLKIVTIEEQKSESEEKYVETPPLTAVTVLEKMEKTGEVTRRMSKQSEDYEKISLDPKNEQLEWTVNTEEPKLKGEEEHVEMPPATSVEVLEKMEKRGEVTRRMSKQREDHEKISEEYAEMSPATSVEVLEKMEKTGEVTRRFSKQKEAHQEIFMEPKNEQLELIVAEEPKSKSEEEYAEMPPPTSVTLLEKTEKTAKVKRIVNEYERSQENIAKSVVRTIDESKKETEQGTLAIKNNFDVEASKLSSNRDKIREVFHMDVAEIIIEREQQRP